jgi:hypothetical protein
MQEQTPFGNLAKLIRKRQAEEGNTPCFATSGSYECSNKGCCWHHECFDAAVDMRLSQGRT